MITKKPEAIEKKQSFTTEQIQENLLALQKYDVTDSKQINQLRIEESERLKNSYIQSTKVSDSLRTEVYKHLSDLKDVTVIGTESPHQMKLGEKSSWEMEQKNKYPIQTTIQRIKKEKETSITENLSDLDRESTTFMILNTFIKGYATTKNGMILQNQNENKEFDSGFIKAYLSDNKEERNVYLQQFTDEFLEYEMSENIFDDTYLKYHADELVRMYEKLSCFPILMKENPEFFDNLDDVIKQLIEIRLENIQYEYCSMLKYRMGANGIRIDDGKEIDDISIINTYCEAALQAREGFKNKLTHTEELQQALFIESFEERVKNNIETNINLEEVEDLKNVRELFSNYPEQYANHKDFFENVYQKYYRITDSLSYVYAEEQAHKNVWNDYKNENNHGHRILSNLIENRLTNMHVKKLIMQKNLEDFKELIHYVIGHTPILTNGAKLIAEQENLIEEVKIIQDERFEFILENESVDMSELEPIAKTNKKINEKLKKDAFRYGIPQLQAMRHMIQEQANVSLTEVDKMLSKGNGRLLCKQSEHYFNILSKENISGKLTELYQTHKEFVNTCQSMSEKLQKGNKIEQKLAASLGYIAMKAMTNASMSANIMEEYRYLSVIEEKKGSVIQLMNWDVMGIMYGSLGKSNAKRIVIDRNNEVLSRLDTLLRNNAKNQMVEYKDDKEFLAILQTCTMYENFMEQAYIPPCTTEKEQATYKLVIEDLSKKLLAYNDRISILTIRYLDQYSDNPKKKQICRVLEHTVLYRKEDNSIFERVAELAYRLRDNGFQDTEFNKNYTNRPLKEALAATRFHEVTIGTDYKNPSAGQLSEVWIPKNIKTNEKNYVYRKGYTYRKVNENEIIDIDEVKGGIVGFETTQGRVIDTHKANAIVL